MLTTDRTIAAVSTPPGKGGIAVIRISGKDAIEVASKVFRPASGRPLSEYAANSAVYGNIFEDSERLDDGMAVIFRAPHSYTGEDAAELSCHGGILITRRVLGAVLSAGAVMAGPGEFTRRAFIAGKLSLSQAEAVVGLINAESAAQLTLYSAHASGAFSRRITAIRSELLGLLSSVYAYIDFPDEDMTDMSPETLLVKLEGAESSLASLEETYKTGHAVAEGIPTVIAGRPNTGKSSLLNLLLGRDRAIVTAEAGTTRDTIEETAFAGPVTLRLCDTAGLRDAGDEAERFGVRRASEKLKEAQLVLAVFDGSEPLTDDDRRFLGQLDALRCEKLALINKSDLPQTIEKEEIEGHFSAMIPLCCKTGEGKGAVIEKIKELFTSGSIENDRGAVIVNARQYADVKAARESISDAISALNASITQDVAGLDIEHALTSLSEADGRTVTGDIVDEIFSHFCVGK